MLKIAVVLKTLASTSFLALMGAMDEDLNKFAAKTASNVPYLVAIVVIILLGIVLVLGVTLLRPQQDLMVLIGVVGGFLTPTLIALLALLKTNETHMAVNSQMEEMKGFMKKVYFAEGMAEGRVPVVTITAPSAPAPQAVVPQIVVPAAPSQQKSDSGGVISSGDKVVVKKE